MDALETVEGGALAVEILDMLESELVRFRHRVLHDHGVELDRARAALVLLTHLVRAGVPWKPKADSNPLKICEAFDQVISRDPEITRAVRRDRAGFFALTAGMVIAPEDTTSPEALLAAKTPSAALRRYGAEPSLWWWSSSYPDFASCWAACGTNIERLIQVAFAAGVPTSRIVRAIALAFGVLSGRVKTRFTQQRLTLVSVLEAIVTDALDDEKAAVLTKLAFEMTAARQLQDPRSAVDPIADLATHTFELIELSRATKEMPDLEHFASVASKLERLFTSRGVQLGQLLRAELDEDVVAAIAG